MIWFYKIFLLLINFIINYSQGLILLELIKIDFFHLHLNLILVIFLSEMRSVLILFVNIMVLYDSSSIITAFILNLKPLSKFRENVLKLLESQNWVLILFWLFIFLFLFFRLLFINVCSPQSENILSVNKNNLVIIFVFIWK